MLNPLNELFFEPAQKRSVFFNKIIELSSDSSLTIDLKNLVEFWATAKGKYQELNHKAIKYLLPFTNTALVEGAFYLLCIN